MRSLAKTALVVALSSVVAVSAMAAGKDMHGYKCVTHKVKACDKATGKCKKHVAKVCSKLAVDAKTGKPVVMQKQAVHTK